MATALQFLALVANVTLYSSGTGTGAVCNVLVVRSDSHLLTTDAYLWYVCIHSTILNLYSTLKNIDHSKLFISLLCCVW